MKIGKATVPHSAICTSNEDTIVVRGHDLARDLIGQVSFGDHFFLLLTGRLPDAATSAVINATLVAIAEHGLVADGADFLDVGGVKAGPGPEVSTEQELERVVPAIEALVERFDLPISVDTWNPVVLDAALGAGAVVGNDISGFAHPEYLPVCARHGASVVATHIRLGPRIPDPEPVYGDMATEVRAFLRSRAEDALAAGIPRCRIMVDDGLDLGKTEAQSLELLRTSEVSDADARATAAIAAARTIAERTEGSAALLARLDALP